MSASPSCDPLPLARLAQATGIPKPTVYRIVQSLVELGYIVQDEETGHYLRTPSVEALGRNSKLAFLRYRLQPAMEELLAQFNETVHLAVLSGNRVHYLSILETTRPLRRITPVELGEPFYATAIGRAFAAWLPEEERRLLIERTELVPLTPYTIVDRDKLIEELNLIRERGWAVQMQECELGVACVAAPVLEEDRPVAAISVTMPHVRLTEEKKQGIIEALLSITRGVRA